MLNINHSVVSGPLPMNCFCLLFKCFLLRVEKRRKYIAFVKTKLDNLESHMGLGSSLVVQWIGFGAFTAVAQVQSLVRMRRNTWGSIVRVPWAYTSHLLAINQGSASGWTSSQYFPMAVPFFFFLIYWKSFDCNLTVIRLISSGLTWEISPWKSGKLVFTGNHLEG